MPLKLPQFTVRFDPRTGALAQLQPGVRGQSWCDARHPIGLFRYQTFSQADYDRWLREYCINMDKSRCRPWAIPDLAKPELDRAVPRPRHAMSLLRTLRHKVEDEADVVVAELGMPPMVCRVYGAPRAVLITYRFRRDAPVFDLTLQWFDKKATRLPEASWLTFAPRVKTPAQWMMDKMGAPVSPLDVVEKGNRSLHAVTRGIAYEGLDGRITIESLDAPLVAPGAPRLLRFDGAQPPLAAACTSTCTTTCGAPTSPCGMARTRASASS